MQHIFHYSKWLLCSREDKSAIGMRKALDPVTCIHNLSAKPYPFTVKGMSLEKQHSERVCMTLEVIII